MCGIVGIIGKKANASVLNKMLSTQHHRGPDFTGKCLKKDVALGHNRLSIIDPRPSSNQPFFSKDKRYILIFNGEIYNYIELKSKLNSGYDFSTNSDTEVLLAAYIKWGKACLSQLNGMFSFVIWDTRSSSLFAARDRFGVKPFYYTLKEDSFYFASEIKTLFSAGILKKTNNKVWANYFAFGSYGMPNESFWEGVLQLPGGHSLTYNDGEISIEKWYFFEEEIKKYETQLPFEEAKFTYKQLLEDSINIRFRTDVPLGFNVSGGVDSSMLLALVNKNEKGKDINAYTFYTDNSDYDELPWVEALMNNTDNPLFKVLLKSNDIEILSKNMSDSQDEPFGGIPTLAYGEIFKRARKNDVVVLLDGQGMDEQWAGYDYYVKNSNSIIQGVTKSPFRAGVMKPEFLNLAEKIEYPKPFDDAVKNLQYRDLFYTKIPRALRFNDRLSMAASTELREPFLDYRLVEFAFAQPLEYKINKNTQKYLLRILASDYIPEHIRYAPKRALQTPQREWLANDLKDWVHSEINNLKVLNWFNNNLLDKELKAYFDGDQDSSFHIWQWINTSLLLSKNDLE
ncbi:MAG: asparagine synthase (glutamine-hydrolyzing) [Algibacter sp.]|uniref:asparagine synthase (glutamine-hydrolyzing) n=1 Tax=Algibacter sp. TaxID=1872428 RepID=UPI0026339632|nr:asparagine synthase (glutamine-hydrolyzing) [Algibacter sp.]MDG1729353.1 asparagine synthase (glutamine-hydrolyzing) [Algibacter sp.]MDG2177324.1 asparagine synthase (glutamine-hydrolyzing) [Algibacter sp.]